MNKYFERNLKRRDFNMAKAQRSRTGSGAISFYSSSCMSCYVINIRLESIAGISSSLPSWEAIANSTVLLNFFDLLLRFFFFFLMGSSISILVLPAVFLYLSCTSKIGSIGACCKGIFTYFKELRLVSCDLVTFASVKFVGYPKLCLPAMIVVA